MAGRKEISKFFEQESEQVLKSVEHDDGQVKEQLNQLVTDTEEGKPLALILKDYFESKRCVNINYKKDNLSLSFKIFNTALDLETKEDNSDNIENGNQRNVNVDTMEMGASTCATEPSTSAHQEDQVDGAPIGRSFHRYTSMITKKEDKYWFLKLLAKEKTLKSLCQHPYITAFLDLHYSIVEKARSQMEDSVPHLALTLMFLVLVSTMPGHLHDNYQNVFWLATVPCVTVLVIDLMSKNCILKKCIDQKLQESLVKDIEQPRQKTCFESSFVTFTHILGYMISIAVLVCGYLVSSRGLEKNAKNHDECEENDNDNKLKKALEITLLVYPMLLMGVEVIQMKTEGWRDYIKSSKNRMDLLSILFAITISLVSMSHKNICNYPWMPNLIWIVILLSFTQLIYDIVDCLPNNDNFHAQHYLHMVNQVAKRYFRIIMWFFPFLMAFAACFKAMANTEDENDKFASNLFGAFLRTMVWFVGEVEDNDMWTSKRNTTDNDMIIHIKTEDSMAKLILLAFIFLFVVVVMNLMNAIAIVDIQELRHDVIGIRNRKKIKEIIQQCPEVADKYTARIRQEPEPQSNNWFLRFFIDKGYICESELRGNQNVIHKRKNFLPEATFSEVKEYTMQHTWSKVTPEKHAKIIARKISHQISFHSGPPSAPVQFNASSSFAHHNHETIDENKSA